MKLLSSQMNPILLMNNVCCHFTFLLHVLCQSMFDGNINLKEMCVT